MIVVSDGVLDGSFLQKYSGAFTNLIRSMLDPNPSRRPSCDEIHRHCLVQRHANSSQGSNSSADEKDRIIRQLLEENQRMRDEVQQLRTGNN